MSSSLSALTFCNLPISHSVYTVDKIQPNQPTSVPGQMDYAATAFSFFPKHWNPIHFSNSGPFRMNVSPFRSQTRFRNPIPRNEFPSSSSSSSSSPALRRLISEFESLSEPIDRVKRLLDYGSLLQPSDDSLRTEPNRVKGCTARVWVDVRLDEDGRMVFSADSDSEIAKGFCSCLISVLEGMTPEEVMRIEIEDLMALNIVVGLHGKSSSRVNTWHNVLGTMQKKTGSMIEERKRKQTHDELFSSFVLNLDST